MCASPQPPPPVSASAQPKAECGADEMEPVGSPVGRCGGHRSRWKPGPRLTLPANTDRHHRTVYTSLSWLGLFILILCAFYPLSVVHNHFWLMWNSRIPFPCKHYEQNHCLLDNHLLFPVPLQPKSSSAMFYVPLSWSISATCYSICVCILLQPITQGLCHYIFMSCFLSDPQYL